MYYQHVRIAAVGVYLPPREVTSAEIEQRLDPIYSRLRLPPGRLELMSGIISRRFWAEGTRPSEVATEAGRRALAQAGIDPRDIGMLIHGSVCRDYLEPATANLIHHALGLPATAMIFDLSNACLGVLNGMAIVAAAIESQRIRAGLVTAGECGEALVESTIAFLNDEPTVSRQSIKDQVASLTIGSAAAAVLLVAADHPAACGPRLLGGAVRCATQHHALCRGDADHGFSNSIRTLMATRSEALLHAGCQLAGETWLALLEQLRWSSTSVDRVFCHQVGSAHRKLMLDTIGVEPDHDFPTFHYLGNTGAAALPVALGLGLEQGLLRPGQRAALLGIGSGVNCLMLGLEQPL
jgi:3-oxoacyl-[acyl-carrier-protein] synthase-3